MLLKNIYINDFANQKCIEKFQVIIKKGLYMSVQPFISFEYFSVFQYQPNFEMSQNGLNLARFKVFFCICIISDTTQQWTK